MEQYTVELIDELRTLISELGKDGGLISPSIYDTAQVLRLYPPSEGVESGLEWLSAQQEADGGWGDRDVPLARDIPTLACLTTLNTYSDRIGTANVITRGIDFLQKNGHRWEVSLSDDIPVAAELLIPYLLKEASAQGMDVPQHFYQKLIDLGERKRELIRADDPCAGTPPTFSWEAWGAEPTLRVLDNIFSVGHSPTATVAWIGIAKGHPILQNSVEGGVNRYLKSAARATGLDIPGVVPTAWPIDRFEQSFSLYWLLIADLFNQPALQDVIQMQVEDLQRAVLPTGLGFSDYFLPDGDDSAAGVAVLQAAGHNPDRNILRRFEHDQHHSTYPHELQYSLTVTARCVHALGIQHEDTTRWRKFLVACQQPDGRWIGDKWNISWLYTTCHVLLALRGSGQSAALRAAYCALLEYQHIDGGWGIGMASNMTETAYGILALYTLAHEGFRDDIASRALHRAHHWLLEQYSMTKNAADKCWLNKELYRPHRVDQVFILAALLSVINLQDSTMNSDALRHRESYQTLSMVSPR